MNYASNKYFIPGLLTILGMCCTCICKEVGTGLRNNVERNISNELSVSTNETLSADFQDSQIDEMEELKVILKKHQDGVKQFSTDIQNQIKVIRNATMFLITIISTKGKDCPGIRDTASKLRILHTALALQDPDIRINIPDDILQSLPEEPQQESDYDYELPDYYDELQTTSSSENAMVPLENTSTERTRMEENYTNINGTYEEESEVQSPCSYSVNGNIPPLICASESPTPIEVTEEVTENPQTISISSTTDEIPTESVTPITTNNYSHTDKKALPLQKKNFRSDDHTARKSSHIRSAFRCPDVAKKIGNECFSLHLDQHMNWTSARSFCRSLGGDLAEPNLRNDRLPKMLLKAWPSLRSSEYWTLWVGATDIEKEGEWHWVTGGILDLGASSRWDLVEPPSEGEVQDCLAMILWVPGRWRRWDLLDDSCDLKWAVYCEYSGLY